MQIALTFDIDMVHYDVGEQLDEMEVTFDGLRECLKALPDVKTTWFVRLDGQIEKVYGAARYIFERHASELDWLRSHGHEIGWHHHAYRWDGARWTQETDDKVVCEHLKRYGECARKSGLEVARMGWGFHTNRTMKAVDGMGFSIDTSAMPRPKYRWNTQACDWSTSPRHPYHPSVHDYRVAGVPHLAIWEVPLTTTEIPMPTDTEPNVVRNIELACDSEIFKKAVASLASSLSQTGGQAVVVCHPYQTVSAKGRRALSFCDTGNVRSNLETLAKYGKRFSVISEMVK